MEVISFICYRRTNENVNQEKYYKSQLQSNWKLKINFANKQLAAECSYKWMLNKTIIWLSEEFRIVFIMNLSCCPLCSAPISALLTLYKNEQESVYVITYLSQITYSTAAGMNPSTCITS